MSSTSSRKTIHHNQGGQTVTTISVSILSLSVLALVGCTSVSQRTDGTWDVPKQVEVRSPFGTNQSAMRVENCTTKVHHAFGSDDYLNCTDDKYGYTVAHSQGQGGQIVSGMIMGLGFGLGLAHGGSTQNATTDVRASTVNPQNAPVKK